MPEICRLFVEKRPDHAAQAAQLLRELREDLGLEALEGVRILARYDLEGLSPEDLEAARWTVFAEPPLDEVHDGEPPLAPGERALAVEYLPGQYDQRADSTAQCLRLLAPSSDPRVATARVYVLRGPLSEPDLDRIRAFLVNPVDSREASPLKPDTLEPPIPPPEEVPWLPGFRDLDEGGLEALRLDLGLAMTGADLAHTRRHFREEGRDPSLTELRVLDTYWSDHCRHTTFHTRLAAVDLEEGPFSAPLREALDRVRGLRGGKPWSLMDLALLPARTLAREGRLRDQEATEEINACSLIVDIDNTAAPGGREAWLLQFKNETHNHPTEIEPFGGAATCLGGAIRDPLSGRAYVYQSMRVTGSGDPREAVAHTLPGRLPQRRITRMAAQGFASYGNQVGLATGQVTEYYDPGYRAKRMEIGAVVGAVPRSQVRRGEPRPGDRVLLVGGRTGRDGIGGATGSSRAHTEHSMARCGAEVQKGDPPMERRLQRLFRRPEACRLIRKCNDFGAGGVAVAIGELAQGLHIDLDAVPRKYEGLDGTELAISESQERMALVVAPEDVPALLRLAEEENLDATEVARVTLEPRLAMAWRGRTLVDLSRAFLDTQGAPQTASARVEAPLGPSPFAPRPGREGDDASLASRWLAVLGDLGTCSQRGLAERFDSTIGAATVLLPHGGRRRRTPAEAMVARFPLLEGETDSASAMSHAFFPALSRWSPFHGAQWAHVQAAARIVAAGGSHRTLRFTLQEYFGRPGGDPRRWGAPVAALLGALSAQLALGTPAIGGKDSMSGTFKDLDVPPTLVAFAVDVVKASRVPSPEWKGPGHDLVLLELPVTPMGCPDWGILHLLYDRLALRIREGAVLAVRTVAMDGLAPALALMAFGNGVGAELAPRPGGDWFAPRPGSFVLELVPGAAPEGLFAGLPWSLLGRTVGEPLLRTPGMVLPLDRAEAAWEAPLEGIFPTRLDPPAPPLDFAPFPPGPRRAPALGMARPRALLAVFPGTNCEFDTARAFEEAGAVPEALVFRNLDARAVEASLEALARSLAASQILVIPGGFSAGDEPDGSGKYIAAAFRNPRVRDAVHELLRRDGLVLGICNGFQALIKLGLVPHGEIRPGTRAGLGDGPTLTFNSLRYASRMATTRVVSTLSPWFSRLAPGDLHTVAVAHGEGRVAGPGPLLEGLLARGQVAAQYVDPAGRPSMDLEYNPSGSALAIEALTSPDGRILGKMAHPERYAPGLWVNAPGAKDMEIFRSGVDYFRA